MSYKERSLLRFYSHGTSLGGGLQTVSVEDAPIALTSWMTVSCSVCDRLPRNAE